MNAGATEEAIGFFLASISDVPNHKAYELLGECYMKLGRLPLAILHLAAATTLNRGVRAPSLLAEAWLAFGDISRALEIAEVALARDPKNKKALALRQKLSVHHEP